MHIEQENYYEIQIQKLEESLEALNGVQDKNAKLSDELN